MKTVEVLVPGQIKKQQERPRFRLDARGTLYAAPTPLADLESTGPGPGRPSDYLLYDRRDEAQIAIHWTVKGAAGAVKLRRKGNTARFSFGPVIAAYPVLRVSRGYLCWIGYSVVQSEEGPMVVLDLTDREVKPTGRSRKRQPEGTEA